MNAVQQALAGLGQRARFGLRTAVGLIRMDRREAVHQAYALGVGSMLVVLLVCGFAGAMLTVQGFASLKSFGTPELLGMFVAFSGVREVFPLVGGGCVGAKVGSAMAAEVATLRLGQQIDALEVMAVDPMRYLVGPRLCASLVVTPILVGMGLCAGLATAYLTATLQLGVDPGAFTARALENIRPRDVAAVLSKGLAFGLITGVLGCWHGYGAAGGPQAVGRAANKTVVQTMMVGALINLAISDGFYGVGR